MFSRKGFAAAGLIIMLQACAGPQTREEKIVAHCQRIGTTAAHQILAGGGLSGGLARGSAHHAAYDECLERYGFDPFKADEPY